MHPPSAHIDRKTVIWNNTKQPVNRKGKHMNISEEKKNNITSKEPAENNNIYTEGEITDDIVEAVTGGECRAVTRQVITPVLPPSSQTE